MAVKKKVVEIDTQQATTSVKELRQQLKQLKDTMLSTEQGTEEYNKALRQSAEIMHTLKEQNEELNASAMDFGQITGNIVKATGGLVAGLQAAKATMNLFGVENETVIKSLQQMQNLMAITQALPALDNGVKAFKRLGLVIKSVTAGMNGFKAALISTGIGAAVVAVGLLAANWDKVTDAMKRWGIINEDTKTKLDEQKKKVEELNGEIARLQGKYEDWERQQKYSKLNENAKKEYDNITNSLEGLGFKLQEVNDLREKENAEQASGWKARWNQYNQEGIALLNQITQLKNRQKSILDNADSYKQLKKEIKETGEESNKVSELEILMWDAIQKMTPSSLQDELLAKFGGSGIPIPVKFVPDEEEEEDTSFEDAFRQKIESTVESLRNAFITPDEQYQQEIDALDVALNTKLIKEEEYLKLRDALNREQTQREVMRYSTAAASIGDIFNSLGDLMEEGSKEQKALQIMGATINMLGGITAAIAGAFTTHSGPWDIALAAIQATAIAASGAATIAKMAKTNKNNASSGSSYKPSTAALTSLTAPVQYTQDVQGANIEGAIKDTRVVVTEGDISSTQKRVHVAESENRY